MIDVDARGRHEAELLRDEAARFADTETALQSVLDGVILIPLVAHRESPPRLAVTRRPASVRRRIVLLVGVAAAVVVVAVLAFRPSNDPVVITPADTAVTSSAELVVRPLDPPIECELELCPSLAVSPGGTLVAYDKAAKTLTWYDGEPHVVPVNFDLDAEHVQLVAVGPSDTVAYLLAGSPDTESWDLVRIGSSGKEIGRADVASPDVEPSALGVRARYCWSGCEPATEVLMVWEDDGVPGPVPYPELSRLTSDVAVQLGQQRWEIAWPHTLSIHSQVAPRWGGGAVLSLVAESADAPTELVEMLPDGSVQRFGLGDEAVHVLLPDGSAVVWRDGQLVRLSPPQPAAPPAAWSPELTAQTLEPPIACTRLPGPECPDLAVSLDGTLVAYDWAAATLTWYEDEPRVVSLTASLGPGDLMAIGPHDIVYLRISGRAVAVAPSGAEIARLRSSNKPVYPTATGLVDAGSEWPSPNAAPAIQWIDLDGNPITDTRPYPTAKATDAGIEVRLGERGWLLVNEAETRPDPVDFRARSDGGVVIVLDPVREDAQAFNLLELSPDGTMERYFVDTWPTTVLPDGSVIVVHNLQLVHLTLPA